MPLELVANLSGLYDITLTSFATPGQTLENQLSVYAAQAGSEYDAGFDHNILLIHHGSNDLLADTNLAEWQGWAQDLIDLATATGWKVITTEAYHWDFDAFTGYLFNSEADYDNYNSTVNSLDGITAVINTSAIPELTNQANVNNAPYYIDQEHLADDGSIVWADFATPIVQGVLEGSNKVLVAEGGSYALTGSAATVRHAWKVAAASGSYAISGAAAGVKRGRKTGAAAGSYAITGTAATLRRARRNTALAGSYSITGTAATLRRARRNIALAGSYSLTGSDANLSKAGVKVLGADAGSYSITGTAANPRKGRTLVAAAGSYSINGTAAGVKRGRKNTALSGSYSFTGTAASIRKSRVLAALFGAYSLTGQAASIVRGGRNLVAGSGSYLLNGSVAGLTIFIPDGPATPDRRTVFAPWEDRTAYVIAEDRLVFAEKSA